MKLNTDLTKNRRLILAIEAVQLQRKALHSSRWAHLNELGAFELNDAANWLREAADLLNEVSSSILRELPQYSLRAPEAPQSEGRRAA